MSRIFVVEDEALIAMLIEDMLEELQHEVVASGDRLELAELIAREVHCDVAMLDINLNGKLSTPVARILRDRDIPFFFASGYGREGLDLDFAKHVVLTKPFNIDQLKRALGDTLSGCI